MTIPRGEDVRHSGTGPASPQQQSQAAEQSTTFSASQTSPSTPANATEKSSNDSSSTSDPYMHLVDDLYEKGSDYSYKAFEENAESSSEEELSDAATGASLSMPQSAAGRSLAMPGPSQSEGATHNVDRGKHMDRMDSALAHKDLRRGRGFAAWRQACSNRKEKAAAVAAAAAPESPSAATAASPVPKSIYTALAAAPTSPFDAAPQVRPPPRQSDHSLALCHVPQPIVPMGCCKRDTQCQE